MQESKDIILTSNFRNFNQFGNNVKMTLFYNLLNGNNLNKIMKMTGMSFNKLRNEKADVERTIDKWEDWKRAF